MRSACRDARGGQSTSVVEELYILEYQKLSWSLRTSSEMKSWGNLASEGSANAGSSGNENDGAAF